MDKMKIIARIHTDFPEKFGLPRQSGLAPHLTGTIVFEPEFRDINALKGIEDFNYLWLIFRFDLDESKERAFQPTVRPPRLGGNTRMGVFATRSPFRPNPIGLSSVKFEGVKETSEGPVILVSGIDLKDGTAIYDIKPYLKYADSHEDALNGFAGDHLLEGLKVNIEDKLLELISEDKRAGLFEILSQDPRPHYHNDSERVYGISYAGLNISFRVSENILTVVSVSIE